MVEFKAKADEIIKQRWGIMVEHRRANRSYEDVFYSFFREGKRAGQIYGWPFMRGAWCNSRLKMSVLGNFGANVVQYLGIAADEPERIARQDKPRIKLPLVEAGWDETKCRKWCEDNDLLSPLYTTATRGGCWFCHNQPTEQLRLLRKRYPEYWQIMLKWDNDSPVSYKANGRTVHDYEHRFQAEDDGLIFPDDKNFKWSMLEEELNYRWF